MLLYLFLLVLTIILHRCCVLRSFCFVFYTCGESGCPLCVMVVSLSYVLHVIRLLGLLKGVFLFSSLLARCA